MATGAGGYLYLSGDKVEIRLRPRVRTNQWRQSAQGDVIIVRYADDAVIGFQHQYEAEKFLKDLREQLGKYGLELNEDKTRLIRFGRFARQNRDERGEGNGPVTQSTPLLVCDK